MIESRVLLTAFRGSSAEQLIKYANGFDTLVLPNDKIKDSEKLIKKIAYSTYDYVFGFGQKPNIKNKTKYKKQSVYRNKCEKQRKYCSNSL